MENIFDLINSLILFIRSSMILQFVAVLVIVAIVSKLLAPLVIYILRLLTSKTKTDLDDKIIEEARIPIFRSLLLLGLALCVPILDIPSTLNTSLYATIKTLFIFSWIQPLIRIARIIFDFSAKSKKAQFINRQTRPLFDNLALIVIVAVSIYVLFSVWGINMTAWLASAGVVGMAVAFAAKDTLANLISGVFILADKPYSVGDYVVLDSGERGKVTNVGVRSTRILTKGDTEIIVPNSVMGGKKIINETGGPNEKYRVSVDVGVSYDSDIDKVESVLLDIAKNEELACDDPEPRVRFRAFGASSLDYSLLCWVKEPSLRGKALHSLNKEVYKRFKKEGIEIPFPQMDVHLDK